MPGPASRIPGASGRPSDDLIDPARAWHGIDRSPLPRQSADERVGAIVEAQHLGCPERPDNISPTADADDERSPGGAQNGLGVERRVGVIHDV